MTVNTFSSEAGSYSNSSMAQKSDFISVIKINGVPILPPVVR